MASVITLDMINDFAAKNDIDLTDGTQFPGVIGSLAAWESGKGELDAELCNTETFSSLKTAYEAATLSMGEASNAISST